jgi:ligand-binding sensor domain-containing protein
LAYFDGLDIWTVYNTYNSGLPINDVVEPILDTQGKLWIGTFGGGLAKFDGSNWTVYNKNNSALPHNDIYTLALDSKDNLCYGYMTYYRMRCRNVKGIIKLR